MFVGWIRKNTFQADLEEFEKSQIIDKNLILNTMSENQSLCFGAYDDNILVAFITAYVLEKSILLNNFYYKEDVDNDIKARLLKILLNNIYDEDKSIIILSSKEEKEIFSKSGFQEFSKFKKAIYSGGAVAFNFSNATAKSISNENYLPTLRHIDSAAFNEDRSEYITKNMFKSSSLILSTANGYQHSYALSSNFIKISPWIMENGAFDDAEKLLRGVIYHRGLKRLIAFIPSGVSEITSLFSSYNFELHDDLYLMYKNKKPTIDLEMVYSW